MTANVIVRIRVWLSDFLRRLSGMIFPAGLCPMCLSELVKLNETKYSNSGMYNHGCPECGCQIFLEDKV